MGLQTFNETFPDVQAGTIQNANGTANVKLFSGGVQPERVDAILLSNDDTIAHVVNCLYDVGGVQYQLGSVNVPAGSGYSGAASIDLVAALPLTANGGISIGTPANLYLSVSVAMTAGKILTAIFFGAYLG